MEKLVGYSAIGHNRYATTGGSSDAQRPADLRRLRFRRLALAHNGNSPTPI
jgi:amidophosphoribosyltransferase